MPDHETFNIKPIKGFVHKYLKNSKISIDPFARNSCLATYNNDINPSCKAEFKLDAIKFLDVLFENGIKSDLAILDAPYTARQISECYKELGMKVTQKDTQIGSFMKELKDKTNKLVESNGVVLTFGYSTVGMGINRGYRIEEIMMVCGGGAHFDIICMAERKL